MSPIDRSVLSVIDKNSVTGKVNRAALFRIPVVEPTELLSVRSLLPCESTRVPEVSSSFQWATRSPSRSGVDGLADELGEVLADGEIDGDVDDDGDTEADILELGDTLADGDADPLGLTDGEPLADGETLGEAELDGLTDCDGDGLGLGEIDGD